MAGRSRYTEEDRALVYASLVANDWNVKRVARETSFPEQTIRNWSKSWKVGDSKPSAEAVETAVSDFLKTATRIRDKLAISLELDLDNDKLKPSEKITALGVLDDKITRARGALRQGNTSVHVHLPSAAELVAGLAELAQQAQRSVLERHNDIVYAEIVEQPKGLPR